MSSESIAHPPIVAYDEWLTARKQLLAREKEATRMRDALNAARRRLPMVRVEKSYTLTGPEGEKTLRDLFEGCHQLIVYHFMFDPRWETGCMGCTGYVDSLGDLASLKDRETRFVLVSRAPIEKLEAYRQERGWEWPWYSSYGSDFNYDYHATFDARVVPIMHNYRTAEELERMGRGMSPDDQPSESQGISVFFRVGDDVYHTYSSFARGVEGVNDEYSLLDLTPYGRQEDWEDSPPGWPQRPTYG